MPDLADTLVASEYDRLEQAEALVRAYCKWHIAPSYADEEVTVRAAGGRTIMLPSLYVTAVSSVVVADEGLTVADDYYWGSNGVITRVGGWWPIDEDVTVTFTHGYPMPPADVTAVVQAIAQRAVNNPGSLIRTQDGPFSDTYSQTGPNQSLALALLDAEKAMLAPYRIVSVA